MCGRRRLCCRVVAVWNSRCLSIQLKKPSRVAVWVVAPSLLLLFCSSPFICQNFRTTSTLGEERREKKERLLSNWLFRHHGYSREAFFLPDSNSMSGKSNIKKFETYFVFGSSRLSRRDKRIIHLRKKPERYLLEFLTMPAIIFHQILNFWDTYLDVRVVNKYWASTDKVLRYWDIQALMYWDTEILKSWDIYWDIQLLMYSMYWDNKKLRCWDTEILIC